jgi:hypothetical protein
MTNSPPGSPVAAPSIAVGPPRATRTPTPAPVIPASAPAAQDAALSPAPADDAALAAAALIPGEGGKLPHQIEGRHICPVCGKSTRRLGKVRLK